MALACLSPAGSELLPAAMHVLRCGCGMYPHASLMWASASPISLDRDVSFQWIIQSYHLWVVVVPAGYRRFQLALV